MDIGWAWPWPGSRNEMCDADLGGDGVVKCAGTARPGGSAVMGMPCAIRGTADPDAADRPVDACQAVVAAVGALWVGVTVLPADAAPAPAEAETAAAAAAAARPGSSCNRVASNRMVRCRSVRSRRSCRVAGESTVNVSLSSASLRR